MKRTALIIDDGHGLSTPGKRSPAFDVETKVGDKVIAAGKAFRENTFNMNCADYLEINAKRVFFPCYQVAPEHDDVRLNERVTRQHNIYERLTQRGIRTITISIHANAHEPDGKLVWNTANGIETFYKPIVDKQPEEWHNESEKLASFIQEHAIAVRGQRSRRVEPARFLILRRFLGIVVLFESGFMTNKIELEYLASKQYQKAMAMALLNACIEFAGRNPIIAHEKNGRKI